VLTIANLSAGSERYYLRSALDSIDEYYVRGEERGYWVGRGADSLGLSGEVAAEDLRAVLEARSPSDGKSLVSVAASHGRSRPGFDLTFSAPKGVSLVGFLGEPATSKQVLEAHHSAVAQALGYLEREATFVRRGHEGSRSVRGKGLVGAGFVHVTSRSGDPQLHTHVLVANMVEGADGPWSAPDARLLYRHSRTAGFLYQAALRSELTERLGISWRPVRRGMAEPAGTPGAVLEHFSRRRAEIEAAMAEVGASSATAAQVAAYKTRAPKDHSVERSVLVASWRARGEHLGLGRDQLRSLVPGGRRSEMPSVGELTRRLLGPQGLTLHASTFSRQEVLRALAEASPDGASVAALEKMAGFVVTDKASVPLGAVRQEERWSTAELVQTERALLASALGARSAGRAVASPAAISTALAERPGLSDEQASVVHRLLGGGEGLAVLVGPAGTGKTFVLEATRAAWEAEGHRVIGTALAGRTAAALAEAAGIPAFTIARLLGDIERPGGALAADGVVLVDESAMVGTRALSKLWSACEEAGTKLVLVGDFAQVPEIEAGGSFRALASALEAPALSVNRRQAEAWEREALAQLRCGEPAKAVEAYAAHGRVVSADSALEARKAMVADWWAAKATGADAVMFALTRADVDALNRLARGLATDAGQLKGPELEAAERSFAVGDEVVTLRPDRRLGVINGTRGSVASLDIGARSLTMLTEKGDELFLPSSYLDAGYLGWAYALTLHKGQGSTVDRAFLLGGEALYREAGYTGMSRGRASNDVYVVRGAAFEPESHLPAGPERDPVGILTAALNRSRAHELASANSTVDRSEDRAGPAPSLRPQGLVATKTERAAERSHATGPEALALELGPTPTDASGRRRWERAARALERYRSRHEAAETDVTTKAPRSASWQAIERRLVEKLVGRAREGHARGRSMGDDMDR
jgi:conjugative relaxase-like TrwC/TraI family protein